MKNRNSHDSSYRARYESNPSRAARLLEALANRLKKAGDPDLNRKVLMDLADALDIPIIIDDTDDL